MRSKAKALGILEIRLGSGARFRSRLEKRVVGWGPGRAFFVTSRLAKMHVCS